MTVREFITRILQEANSLDDEFVLYVEVGMEGTVPMREFQDVEKYPQEKRLDVYMKESW